MDSTHKGMIENILAIDPYSITLEGIKSILIDKHPDIKLLTASTAEQAFSIVEDNLLDLVIINPKIPWKTGENSKTNLGIQFIRYLMGEYSDVNILVARSQYLLFISLKEEIENHKGGFVILNKEFSSEEFLEWIYTTSQGEVHIPAEILKLNIKPEWNELIQLASQLGLQDKGIAKEMNVSERTVRHYWTKIQDLLEIFPDPDKNTRTQTLLAARDAGWIEI
jgi:DNA-binding NarL/FixJ family response regulator